MTTMRERAVAGLRVGDRFSVTRRIAPEEIAAFAMLSRDYNPVHCDEAYVKLKGMREPIAHGLLTASLLTEIGGQIGWLAMTMTFQFKRPVYADEALTCDWVITAIDERGRGHADICITNEAGVLVLKAETTGVLPSEAERVRLGEILMSADPDTVGKAR